VDDRLAGPPEVGRLIQSQRRFYDLRAPDFGDETKPPDRRVHGIVGPATIRDLLDDLRPSGDVLELACGTGAWTTELVERAESLTAVDGSARMLDRSRETVAAREVEYICADIFDWTPQRRYDTVFFGFWLSHVPPTLFADFWTLVRTCLHPDGRALFVDEDDRARSYESWHTDNGVPTARRTLSDGTEFDIVKVFWRPERLQQALQDQGWQAEVHPVGDGLLTGVARPDSSV
jgi:demethylmenaquinone methyltransferase/2-methoxy-6-polyprenyl-1,4-benzoquinol methylase